jgi:uncharacterized protein YdcH (DUF465 family)
MSVEKRIKHLEEEHHKLDKKIDGLESTGVFDDVEITDLKKQRLRIKTELVTLIQEYREPVYKTEQK